MSAPDFFFAVNAIFRHLHDRYGKEALIDYWRRLATEYYGQRCQRWLAGGPEAVAADWRDYFAQEPQAAVDVGVQGDDVLLDVRVCPAIKHLRDCGRDIVPYYCEHCDHICAAMGEQSGYAFQRTGGMGSCRQRFTRLDSCSRHTPCAVTSRGAAVSQTGGRHTECACYFPGHERSPTAESF
jgi:hypothetical protein